MVSSEPQNAGWHRPALAAVLAASAALALVWVFYVPIFQAPDEYVHFDQALAYNSHRGLFVARGTGFFQLEAIVHPATKYLMERACTNQVAFHPDTRMPRGYGTRAYFAELDRDAPPLADTRCEQPNRLVAVYPFGYYALLAVWIEGLRLVTDRITVIFFGARLLSVVLLVLTLLCVYGSARQLDPRPGYAVLLTAFVGLFPLTSFVCSYVQPDNLSFTFVSLAFYLSLRVRRAPGGLRDVVLLGLTFGALMITKVHYCLVIAVPILAMLAVEQQVTGVPWRRRALAAAVLALPPLAAGGLYLWTVWGSQNYYEKPAGSPYPVLHTLHWCKLALLDFYCGNTHYSFWGIFGWMDTLIVYGRKAFSDVIHLVIQAAAWVLLALTLVRLEQVASRLWLAARRGKVWPALRVACSNPLINSYFFFTVFMIALYVRIENRYGAQGRNWLPFLLPIFLVGLVYAPRALTLRAGRRACSTLVLAGLVFYCTYGSYSAWRTVKKRYYSTNRSAVTAVAPIYTPAPVTAPAAMPE